MFIHHIICGADAFAVIFFFNNYFQLFMHNLFSKNIIHWCLTGHHTIQSTWSISGTLDRRTIIGIGLDTSGADYTVQDIVSSSLEGMEIMMEVQLCRSRSQLPNLDLVW